MQITYNLIEPLIIYAEEEGSKMVCEFEIPGTEQVIESSANIKKVKSVQSQVSRVAKRTVTNQVRRVASRTLRQILGSGMLGRTSSMVFNTASRSATSGMGRSFSKEEKQEAIVDAFKKVSTYFKFDQASGTWGKPTAGGGGGISIKKAGGGNKINVAPRNSKKKEEVSGFIEQLTKNPVSAKYDLKILSRMLVQLAQADGSISDEEKSFLDSFMNEALGTVDDVLAMGEISQIECEEVSDKAKPTILMLAWTISLVDFELDPEEEKMLDSFAEMMEISSRVKEDVIGKAKSYILEQVINEDTRRGDLHNYADQLGMDRGEAERTQIRLEKRIG